MEHEKSRGQTLEMMDAYLASLGLCRKQIANDGSCLFRAVAEQVVITQKLGLTNQVDDVVFCVTVKKKPHYLGHTKI